MYIQKIAPLIIQSFPINWQSQFISLNLSELEEAELRFFQKINEFSIDFFEILNLSVIAGEYSTNIDFLQSIELIHDAIGHVTSFDQERTDQEEINKLNSILLVILRPELINAINFLKHLHLRIERKNTNFDTITLLDGFRNEKQETVSRELKKIKELSSELIRYNIRLAQIDHDLAVKPDILKELVILRFDLNEKANKGNLICKLLFDKCTLLIKKLLYRFKEDQKNYTYALDFVDKELSLDDLHIEYYTKFSELAHMYYEIEKEAEQVDKKLFNEAFQISNLKNKKNQKLNFEDYYCLVKYYKDENVSESNLKFIYDHYSKNNAEIELSESSFDKRAFEITKNYIKNNIVSFETKNSANAIVELRKSIEDIRFLQTTTKVYNYFPYLRACEFLIQKLNQSLEELSVNDNANVDFIKEIIELLDIYEKALYLNFEWCSSRNFQAFQLPWEECTKIIKTEQGDRTIFLASSFILPINYQKTNKDILKLSADINKCKRIYEFHLMISKEKREIKNLKESVDKTEKRSIEILSIFAAIVLFVSSNIQIFSKLDTMSQALGFMLVFTYCLSIFVLLIWIITRENGFNYKEIPALHQILIFILFIATVASFIVVFSFQKSRLKSDKKEHIIPDTVSIKFIYDTIKTPINKGNK